MRLVAEQHAIGGGERQGVGGALLPAQVLRPRHQLAVLHPAELGEGAVRRLVAPDALRGGKHRVAAVALLVVAVVLVAMDDDLVADLPAPNLRPDRPDDARRVGAGDVKRLLVDVEHRHRLAERGPDAVVVDPGGHDEDQHFVAVERPGRHDLDLHRLLGRTVPLLAHHPGVHRRRHMAERAEFRRSRRGLSSRRRRKGGSSAAPPPERMAMTFLVTRAAPAGRRPSSDGRGRRFPPACCTAASDNRAPAGQNQSHFGLCAFRCVTFTRRKRMAG